jgi:hypothetical protein
MKKLIYSTVAVVALSACSNSGSGGPSVPAKPLSEQLSEAQSATDFASTILPEKFTVIKSNLSYEEQKEKYTVGCKIQGEPSWDPYKIDPALRAGLLFTTKEVSSKLLERDTFQTVEKTIAQVEGQKIVAELNLLEVSFGDSLFTSIDQIFSRKPHITVSSTYKEGATDSDFSYVANYTPAALEYLQSHVAGDQYLSCSVSYETGISSNSVDKINYLLNGQNIVAYVSKNSHSGEVTCSKRTSGSNREEEKVNLGHGTDQSILITSNALINESTVNCGGAEVYRMDKIVLDSGKVIKSSVTKTLSAPLR